MRLDLFNNNGFDRGRSRLVEVVWLVVQALLVDSWLPGSAHRVFLLKIFGAKIGKGVVVKPNVKIKFPWRLTVGEHTWIGECVWIDNLAPVRLGNHVCLSQGVYLCTGNHDWSASRFDLVTGEIELRDSVWIGARGVVAPGVTAGEGAVLGMGSLANRDLDAWTIYSGRPAEPHGPRRLRDASDPF